MSGSEKPMSATERVVLELRAATIAITMFGLDKLPEVLRASEQERGQ